MIKHRINFNKAIIEDFEHTIYKLKAVVILDNTNEKLLKFVDKYLKSYTKSVKCKRNGNIINIDITTTSKCNPTDVYNKIKGRRIAESRAKEILYRLTKRISLINQQYHFDLYQKYVTSYNKYWSMEYKEIKHIKDLYNTNI